jgi:YHS domain-containing protein
MLRLLIYAALAYFLWKIFMGGGKRAKKPEPRAQDTVVAKGEMVKDPICGAYVSPDNGLMVRHGGTTRYFCSQECRQEYLRRLEAGEAPENPKG